MFIKQVVIKNFRLFSERQPFQCELNIPDGNNEGSGLTVFVGENGCGKTTLLDAISLPLLTYKSENVSIADFFDPENKIYIEILAAKDFTVARTMSGTFQSKGFAFDAHVRSRTTKNYLSSMVVSDQKYIKADNQKKPEENSPDLRVGVDNPYRGQRYSENDILFLDRNRIFQTRSGAYNSTRFNRLMDDFDFQLIKEEKKAEDINQRLSDVKEKVQNQFLAEAMIAFKEISGKNLSLNLISNWQPFSQAFFAVKEENNQQITLDMLGSGYEMIFSFIYSFYLSKQTGKQLILLIDEPELHLHPALQADLVKLLLEYSKSAQIIFTTHSALLIKQLFSNSNVKTHVLSKNKNDMNVLPINQRVLPYVSANEVNYLAFGLATEEYHNELYGHLQEKSEKYKIDEFDAYLVKQKINKEKQWTKKGSNGSHEPKKVTLQTYIRNFIHHPENRINEAYTLDEIRNSIEQMIHLIKSHEFHEEIEISDTVMVEDECEK